MSINNKKLSNQAFILFWWNYFAFRVESEESNLKVFGLYFDTIKSQVPVVLMLMYMIYEIMSADMIVCDACYRREYQVIWMLDRVLDPACKCQSERYVIA